MPKSAGLMPGVQEDKEQKQWQCVLFLNMCSMQEVGEQVLPRIYFLKVRDAAEMTIKD